MLFVEPSGSILPDIPVGENVLKVNKFNKIICENCGHDLELKEFSAEESMRLFYVAVTRAKKKLYITAPLKVKSFGKEMEQEPSIVFEELL